MNQLVIKNLTVQYADNIVFEDCMCEIFSNDVVLIDGKNGVGKSTLIKTILGIDKNQRLTKGSITFSLLEKNILEMNISEILEFRAQTAYLEQFDYYDNPFESVFDVLKDSYMNYKRKTKLTIEDKSIIREIFYKYIPADSKISLKTKVSKLSGGQQRLLSIIANICIRADSKLFIIDEPLNNLDIQTVVKVSNLLNNIIKNNNDAIFIIVSHCKIFPFINKVLEIKNNQLVLANKTICHSCYGEPDKDGYYEE